MVFLVIFFFFHLLCYFKKKLYIYSCTKIECEILMKLVLGFKRYLCTFLSYFF